MKTWSLLAGAEIMTIVADGETIYRVPVKVREEMPSHQNRLRAQLMDTHSRSSAGT